MLTSASHAKEMTLASSNIRILEYQRKKACYRTFCAESVVYTEQVKVSSGLWAVWAVSWWSSGWLLICTWHGDGASS